MSWISKRLSQCLLALFVSSMVFAWLGRPVSAQIPASAGQAPPDSEQAEFFETTIRPLLAANCHACHGAQVDTPFGGLRLDSREGLLAGGDSGPAIVPGRPAESALVQRLHGRPMLMPPTGPLAVEDISAVTRWVEMGAPWPEAASNAAADPPDPSAPFDLPARRRAHWAWQPVQPAEPPAVDDDAWPATPVAAVDRAVPAAAVDRFILAALGEAGLAPAPDAERAALIRRLSFDLRGLPPTPAEIARFAGDDSPSAYADLVDRYLDSPHFGERWARHWMDLFRYSESHGSEGDPDIPFAWRYRDYLIRAFNDDVPYDRLIREHLAGDLLPDPRLAADGRTNESMIGPANFRLVEHGFQPVDPWGGPRQVDRQPGGRGVESVPGPDRVVRPLSRSQVRRHQPEGLLLVLRHAVRCAADDAGRRFAGRPRDQPGRARRAEVGHPRPARRGVERGGGIPGRGAAGGAGAGGGRVRRRGR